MIGDEPLALAGAKRMELTEPVRLWRSCVNSAEGGFILVLARLGDGPGPGRLA